MADQQISSFETRFRELEAENAELRRLSNAAITEREGTISRIELERDGTRQALAKAVQLLERVEAGVWIDENNLQAATDFDVVADEFLAALSADKEANEALTKEAENTK